MLKLVKTRNKAKDVGPEDNTQAWNIKQEIQDDQSIKWLDTDLEEAKNIHTGMILGPWGKSRNILSSTRADKHGHTV